jgi:hypothetical protein
MNLVRKGGILIWVMLQCSQLFAQEFYQIGFELYKGTSVEFSDIVYCNLESGGNPGVDNSDLQKFPQFNENMSVYRDTGIMNDFGIETRPLVNCADTIQLRLYKTSAISYRIVVDMNLFPQTSGLTAVLQDLFLKNERVLKFGDTTVIKFSVTSNAASTGLRFRIVFRRNLVETNTFQLPAICRGKSVNLPEASSNGVKGFWSPLVDTTQTAEYIFTPSEGQCATVTTAILVVNQPRVPEFVGLGPFIEGDNFTLPATSLNGIIGNWSPAIDNTKTTTYSFTPEASECATTAQLMVVINSLPTTVAERTTPDNAFGVYPNPVDKGIGTIRLKLPNFPAGQYKVTLYSISGYRVQETNLYHTEGAAQAYPIRLNQKINKGIYLIGVEGKQKINLKKILLIK